MNKNIDSTLARIAGNLLCAFASDQLREAEYRAMVIRAAVVTAREIVAEVERTEPAQDKVTS